MNDQQEESATRGWTVNSAMIGRNLRLLRCGEVVRKIVGDFGGLEFLRALEMQGDKISGGLCGHFLSVMVVLFGAWLNSDIDYTTFTIFASKGEVVPCLIPVEC